MIGSIFALLFAAGTPPQSVGPKMSAQEVWTKACASCHGADGKGQTRKGIALKAPDFTSQKWQTDTADEEIEDAITNGVPKTRMVSFKGKLSDAEIQQMIPFIRAFAKQ